MPPRLSQRLTALVEMLAEGAKEPYPVVCDVGCDHGWIAITLCLKNVAERVIASDVREGPLDRAREHVAECGLAGRIDTVLSDGLSHVGEDQARAAVIAGMGGFLIRDIILEAQGRQALPDILILQPQNGYPEVRMTLRDLGYGIEKETMVREDGKYYVILRAVKGADSSAAGKAGPEDTEVRDSFGGYLLDHRDPVLLEYLQREKEKFTGIVSRAPQGTDEAKARLGEIEKAMQYWEV